MSQINQFLSSYGELILFLTVFVEQIGVPFPSAPALLAAGALAAVGTAHLSWAIVSSAAGALAADTLWYYAGHRGKTRLFQLFPQWAGIRLRLVGKTRQSYFLRGFRRLMAAKFFPLGIVVPLRAGAFDVGPWGFLLIDTICSLLYVSLYLVPGFFLHNQLERMLQTVRQLGTLGVVLILLAGGGYVTSWLIKHIRYRQRSASTSGHEGKSGDASETKLESDVQVKTGGVAQLVLHGRLDAQTVPDCWSDLETSLTDSRVKTLHVDASGLNYCDGAGLALLRYLAMGQMTTAAAVSVTGLEPGLETVFRGFTLADYEAFRLRAPAKAQSLLERIASNVKQMTDNFRGQMVFLGAIVASLVRTQRNRWRETLRVLELAGANAVPIVSLMSLLLGFIIAFESARRLAEFGAQLYVANTIMVVMVRDMGPLMTAILLAGRTGSAFAAEIGTMKINEELDALQTFGLDPVPYLVVPRILAGVFLMPLLTFYSILMGVAGGVIVMLGLGFTLPLILHQLAVSVHLADLAVGISKAAVFGVVVCGVGCWQGLQTQEGPSAVGLSTTRAVVSSLLLIIIVDACFSAITYFLK